MPQNKSVAQEMSVEPVPQLKIATFNLFNYLEPPNAFYEFERIYSVAEFAKKQQWICDYLRQYQPDVIGFQEVFSAGSLKKLVAGLGYDYFQVVDQPQVTDGYIYHSPVVAIASRYPIKQSQAVQCDQQLALAMGLEQDFSFSRQVLRASITLPHVGDCDCYVVHFKSKRPMIEHNENKALSHQKNLVQTLKAEISGGWASSIQRGSEAALLLVSMISRRETTGLPMILMGDFNNALSDGVLQHLIKTSMRANRGVDADACVEKYGLRDAWQLYQQTCIGAAHHSPKATHYYGAVGSVLDYILLSCEFDASCQTSCFELSDYHTYDRHLINPIFERDAQSTDHGIVSITLTPRS